MSDEKEIIEKHESYALMGFSRGHYMGAGRGVPLFGSSILHHDTITMVIHAAELRRDLNHDWHHGRARLIEVEMSASQFAEMITTLNVGDGVPVTLRYKDGVRMDDPPYRDRREIVRSEFKERTGATVEKMRDVLSSVERIFAEGTVKKADKEKIISDLKLAIQHVASNLPYVSDCFEKTVTETVTEAKAEIEAFMDHAVRSAGLTALQADMRPIELLEESNEAAK